MDEIVGYTYRADLYRPEELIETFIGQRRLAPGARGMRAEDALDQLAAIEDIDRDDERTFDSGEFPKVIFRCNLDDGDFA